MHRSFSEKNPDSVKANFENWLYGFDFTLNQRKIHFLTHLVVCT